MYDDILEDFFFFEQIDVVFACIGFRTGSIDTYMVGSQLVSLTVHLIRNIIVGGSLILLLEKNLLNFCMF